MVRKAVKKPVEISYMTFNDLEDYLIMGRIFIEATRDIVWIMQNDNEDKLDYCEIPTLEGTMKMTNEDILIIGVRGEIYPCKIDIFEETYNKIEEERM